MTHTHLPNIECWHGFKYQISYHTIELDLYSPDPSCISELYAYHGHESLVVYLLSQFLGLTVHDSLLQSWDIWKQFMKGLCCLLSITFPNSTMSRPYIKASHVNYDRYVSSIFVVLYSRLNSMCPQTILKVFRKHHILVTDIPFNDESFDAEGLSKVGSLSWVLDRQGEMMPSISLVCLSNITWQLVCWEILVISRTCIDGGHWVTWPIKWKLTILMS